MKAKLERRGRGRRRAEDTGTRTKPKRSHFLGGIGAVDGRAILFQFVYLQVFMYFY
ncbi:MAG: hypothetical protein P4N60_03540 [Verrucomicrobiae bacterium]|nr:hypothetical protein [Verrucomicrobiae bacterium]